jgi:hypothetical protein
VIGSPLPIPALAAHVHARLATAPDDDHGQAGQALGHSHVVDEALKLTGELGILRLQTGCKTAGVQNQRYGNKPSQTDDHHALPQNTAARMRTTVLFCADHPIASSVPSH